MVAFIISSIVLILSMFQGLRMFIDGIYNLITGDYLGGIGPNNLWNTWWYVVKSLDLQPEKWGVVLVIFGFVWIVAVVLYLFFKVPGRIVIMILCLLTLWHVFIGASLSIVIFILNFFVGNKSFLKTDIKKITNLFKKKIRS